MKFLKYTLLLFLGTIFMFSCEEEDDLIDERLALVPDPPDPVTPPTPTAGDANFTNYVAIGNSLTAGFADGALFPLGQRFAYPSILAGQFAGAGGGLFNFPNITTGNGFGGLDDMGNPTGRFAANTAAAADPNAALSDIIVVSAGSPLIQSTVSPINNYGVPGARIVDAVTAGYGAFNPFYGAFQSSETASMVGDAAAANPSFFSVWLGNNDVLGYAIDGARADTFDPFNPSSLTDAGSFAAALSGTLDALSANGSSGVILNIPPITIIPFFQFVTLDLATGLPNVNIIPLDEATAGAVNQGFAGYNAILNALTDEGTFGPLAISQEEAALRQVSFQAGTNAPIISDENLTDLTAAFDQLAMIPPENGGITAEERAALQPFILTRELQQGELLTLTSATVVGQPLDPANPLSVQGVALPLGDSLVLTGPEIVTIVTQIATFNGIIAAEVAARDNLYLVDVNPIFADLFGLTPEQAAQLALGPDAMAAADGIPGVVSNGFNLISLTLDPNTILQSVFSTDLVHPNQRGQALIANEVIDVINEQFNATIQEVNPLDFPSVNLAL